MVPTKTASSLADQLGNELVLALVKGSLFGLGLPLPPTCNRFSLCTPAGFYTDRLANIVILCGTPHGDCVNQLSGCSFTAESS